MKLLSGKKISREIISDLKKKISRQRRKPALAVILVGENKASKIYTSLKARAAKKAGIGFQLFKFKSSVKEKEIIKLIKKLNNDKIISGIIVQLPLPKKIKTEKIISYISPMKDADGFHQKNIKEFIGNKGKIFPVFPQAIVKLIESSRINLAGKKAVVIANSNRFGSVMDAALKRKKIKSEYIISNKISQNLSKIGDANIIVVAVGRLKLIKGKMLKKGATVIDGGIVKKDKKIYGDVDFNSVANVAGYLSPVPGGVGPVTVACLLKNVYELDKMAKK